MDAPQNPAPSPTATPGASKRKRIVLFAALGMVLLGAIGGSAWYVLHRGGAGSSTAALLQLDPATRLAVAMMCEELQARLAPPAPEPPNPANVDEGPSLEDIARRIGIDPADLPRLREELAAADEDPTLVRQAALEQAFLATEGACPDAQRYAIEQLAWMLDAECTVGDPYEWRRTHPGSDLNPFFVKGFLYSSLEAKKRERCANAEEEVAAAKAAETKELVASGKYVGISDVAAVDGSFLYIGNTGDASVDIVSAATGVATTLPMKSPSFMRFGDEVVPCDSTYGTGVCHFNDGHEVRDAYFSPSQLSDWSYDVPLMDGKIVHLAKQAGRTIFVDNDPFFELIELQGNPYALRSLRGSYLLAADDPKKNRALIAGTKRLFANALSIDDWIVIKDTVYAIVVPANQASVKWPELPRHDLVSYDGTMERKLRTFDAAVQPRMLFDANGTPGLLYVQDGRDSCEPRNDMYAVCMMLALPQKTLPAELEALRVSSSIPPVWTARDIFIPVILPSASSTDLRARESGAYLNGETRTFGTALRGAYVVEGTLVIAYDTEDGGMFEVAGTPYSYDSLGGEIRVVDVYEDVPLFVEQNRDAQGDEQDVLRYGNRRIDACANGPDGRTAIHVARIDDTVAYSCWDGKTSALKEKSLRERN